MNALQRRGRKNPIPTNTPDVDSIIGAELAKGDGNPYGDDDSTDSIIGKAMSEAMKTGGWFSLGRSLKRMHRRGSRTPVDGLEKEIHDELAHATNRSRSDRWLVPWNLPVLRAERRTGVLNVGAGAGSIATQLPRNTLVDVLRAKRVIEALGGKTLRLTNAPGYVQIPVKSGTVTTAWVAEGVAAGASNMNVGAPVPMRPNTITALTAVSRKLLDLTEPEFEDQTIDDLVTAVASAIDIAALAGNGPNQPFGIFYNTALQTIALSGDSGNGAKPACADLALMESTLGQINGDSEADARIALVTSNLGRSALRRVDLGGAAGVGAQFAWKRHPIPLNGEVAWVEEFLGYHAMATEAVPSNLTRGSGSALTAAALGNWADHITCLFGPLELLVDWTKQSTQGQFQLSIFQDVDCALRRPNSMVVLPGIVTS